MYKFGLDLRNYFRLRGTLNPFVLVLNASKNQKKCLLLKKVVFLQPKTSINLF